MISSVFGKTKPINYVIILVFLFAFYWIVHLHLFQRTYTLEEVFLNLAVFAVLFLTVFLVNFIASRNKATEVNSYAILMFTALIVLFPESVMDKNAVLCNFFVMLAIRRLISMRSLKALKMKIFDATFWILSASLWYDWALLFLVLVFISIYYFDAENIRNWFVPLISAGTFFLIVYAFSLLNGQASFLKAHYTFSFSFDVAYFFDWVNSVRLLLYAATLGIVGIIVFVKSASAGISKIILLRLLAIFFFMALVVKLLETGTNAFPIMLTFFPASIILTNFVETIKKVKIREAVLFVLVLIPLVVFFSNLPKP